MNDTPETSPSSLSKIVERWLERADIAVYAVVAVLFLGAAVAMVIYSVIAFFQNLNDGFPLDVITSINDLLLVLIILEVLGTVRSYLMTGTTSLTPFLYIGIISATRRILAIGAATTLGEATSDTVFHRQMIDLGANGGVVLALAIALFLFSRQRTGAPEPASGEEGERWA